MSKIDGGLHCKQGKVGKMDFKISERKLRTLCSLVPIFFVSFESESPGPHSEAVRSEVGYGGKYKPGDDS